VTTTPSTTVWSPPHQGGAERDRRELEEQGRHEDPARDQTAHAPAQPADTAL
jgi:hypothetical protein